MAIVPVPNACTTCGPGGDGGTAYDFENDIVCVVIDGEMQTAFRREVYDAGVATVVFVGVDGSILIPDSWSPGDCPCEGGLVFQEILCDDGTDPVTPFIRIYEYAANGLLESTTDFELDGTTPYVVTGDVVVCSTPITVDGTVELGAATLEALETVTVLQGTSPWVVSGSLTIDGDVSLDAATLASLENVTVTQGTSPWVVSGTVELGAATLAALESVTVSGTVALDAGSLAALETVTALQGTSPWVVSGTVAVTQSTSPWVVSGTVELGAASLAALETITALQGTSPWVVSGTVAATISGTITTADANFTTATRSDVAGSATVVTLIASNANRREIFIHNDSTSILRIKYGSAASATDFTAVLTSQGSFSASTPLYTGIITGIWESGTGFARMTEVSP